MLELERTEIERKAGAALRGEHVHDDRDEQHSHWTDIWAAPAGGILERQKPRAKQQGFSVRQILPSTLRSS